MKKRIFLILIAAFVFIIGCTKSAKVRSVNSEVLNTSIYEMRMKQDILCLMMGYPEYIVGAEKGEDGNVYVVMKSGKKILYDDKNEKDHEQAFENADIEDMMSQIYPLGGSNNLMEEKFNPGRNRVYPLLKEVYGGSKTQVEKNLVNVNTGKRTLFNKNNGASNALASVMKELAPLTRSRGDVSACVYPNNGTFNYRVISGTRLLSPHSFGIAIDLASDRRDYWKWATREQGAERLSKYPPEIPEIFERYGFVWGGKWGHFDTLHFEYRPEIIMKARYFGAEPDLLKRWYDGASMDNADIMKYIEVIDSSIN